MPTFDRRRFVPDAIENFLLQDHPNRELVIVDDGADPIGDLVPDDPAIRHVRLDRRISLGAKRNAACEVATGDIIVHWDDDDWSAPERIAVQVAALLESGADVCGLRELLFYEPSSDRGWHYRYPASARPWVAGGTMCYRRELWRAHPFADVRQGEDTQFVWSRRTLRIHAIERPELYVAMIHRANTSAKRTSGRRWSSVPGTQIRAVLGLAESRYCTSATPPPWPAQPDPEVPVVPPARNGPPATVVPTDPKENTPMALTARDTASGATAPNTDGDHVTVSIPHAGPGEHLRAAVNSILCQTHRDLTCVVVFDGDRRGLDAVAGIDDPRLVRHLLPTNRGRYFADQVVLEATSSAYFVVQDSDDWSEPTRVERLLAQLRAEQADVCVSDAVQHDARHGPERSTRCQWPRLHDPVGPQLVHRAGHQGLYRTEALRSVGGWYGGFQIGFDTSILNFVLLAGGRIASVDEALYHRRIRAGSLSTSAATGWGTPTRRRVVEQLRDLHRSAHQVSSAAGDREAAAAAIADLVRARLSTEERSELETEARRLAAMFTQQTSIDGRFPKRPLVATEPPAARTLPRVPDVYEILNRCDTTVPSWAISPRGAIELYERLLERRPRRILEAGSGRSTLVEAAAAARCGGRVTSLEHDPQHAERTRRLLVDAGLADVADVITAPLVDRAHPSGKGPWYDGQPEGRFDFFVVDGPPLRCGGRSATFPAVAPHRLRDWEFWLFDSDRPNEQSCLAGWSHHHRFDMSLERVDDTGVAVLTPRTRSTPAATPVVVGLGISILGGGRPDLLERTLTSFEHRWPDQVDRAYVCAFINGPDEASRAVLARLSWIDRLVTYESDVLTIGTATSFVVGSVAGHGSVRAVLHLEDDWETCTVDDSALARSSELLADPTIGQVRLRHRSEPALTRHMITRRPIEWMEAAGHRRAAAHFTFNPALVRSSVADRIFPARDEVDAQRRFAATGLDVAHVTPGAFRHIGGENSRRAALGRAR